LASGAGESIDRKRGRRGRSAVGGGGKGVYRKEGTAASERRRRGGFFDEESGYGREGEVKKKRAGRMGVRESGRKVPKTPTENVGEKTGTRFNSLDRRLQGKTRKSTQ